MSSFYSAEPLALLKLLCHAAKYPHASVNGLLLGRRAQGGGDDDKAAGGGGGGAGSAPASPREAGTRIVDAVPLFHAGLTLAPMLEVALAQARRVATHPPPPPRPPPRRAAPPIGRDRRRRTAARRSPPPPLAHVPPLPLLPRRWTRTRSWRGSAWWGITTRTRGSTRRRS